MSSINRQSHCLIREKTLAMPRHIILFDTETKPKELENGSIQQILKLGWACYYGREHGRHIQKVVWQNFYDTVTFWDFVFQRCQCKQKLWLIARNLTFDFTVLKGWFHLKQAGYKVRFFHSKGSTTIISVRAHGRSILFVDSLNWFKESLAATGKRIGIPKLQIDFDTCTDDYLNAYCKRDVEIELENIIQFIRFLEGNGVSRLCYTIGSTAMAAYLLNHYHKKIYIHNNQQAIDLERASYKGGRVECFYIGEKTNEDCYVLDVNSLYPSVMSDNLYPVKYERILHQTTPDTLCQLLTTKAAIAKVLINTDEPAYAVKRDRTIFPVGRFWTTLTTPELKYALTRGHILQVTDCVLYEQDDIFTSYVKRFYALRQEFKSVNIKQFEEICKLLLNCLYGKFGQKADVWEKIGDCPNEPDRIEEVFDPVTNKRTMLRFLLGEVFEATGYEECYNSFPAISSHVTAYGRLRLWELIKQAGYENVFYCDTDSMIVNEAGLCYLQSQIDNVILGKLKVEETTTNITIRGLKDYTTLSKNVIKGIRKNAVQVRAGVYEQEQWPSFRGTLRSGNADVYTIKKITKVLDRKYTKGIVNPDGLVVPFSLVETYQLRLPLY